MYASIGSPTNEDKAVKGSELIRVTDIFIHPRNTEDTFDYDVGLVKLEKPSTKKLVLLCAADGSDNKPGTMGTVLG
ncbi:unnamed protein product [Phytophthora lilii]|uniref:Unnamed protein product n=1 Tax=Phytophthora lilii TaxID=2077276 RepID=A0A9W6U8X0_9STRA|nr:unnamed protein product [Phytophthora lilii]